MVKQPVSTLRGRVWRFGDYVDMFHFVSGKYDGLAIAGRFADIAPHILEDSDPTFVKRVKAGDILVAGKGFGKGKHHFLLIGALQEIGIEAVIAESIDPAFQRDAIDRGFPALSFPKVPPAVQDGDIIEFDMVKGEGRNLTQNSRIVDSPMPLVFLAILQAGGLEGYTLQRVAAERDQGQHPAPIGA